MGKMITFFDYVFLARPVLFYPVWTVFFAGIISAQKPVYFTLGSHWHRVQSFATTPTFFLSFLALSFMMGAIFIMNQFSDVHSDKENKKLFLIANGLVSKKWAIVEIFVLLMLAFIISFFFGLEIIWLLFFLFILTGVMYSVPPFSCKDRPFSGLSVNLIGGLLTFLVGWRSVVSLSSEAFFHAIPYVFAIGAVYFLTTIPDIKGDKNSGKRTFAVKFGPRFTIYTGLLFEVLCIFTSIWQLDWVILLPAIATLFFFLRLIWAQYMVFVVQATRIPILFLSLAVCLFIPLYFVLFVGIFFLSRWYYMKRFELRYPSFSPL